MAQEIELRLKRPICFQESSFENSKFFHEYCALLFQVFKVRLHLFPFSLPLQIIKKQWSNLSC